MRLFLALCRGISGSDFLPSLGAEFGPHSQSKIATSSDFIWQFLLPYMGVIPNHKMQGNRAVFNQFQVNPTCRLCTADPETRQHFISECTFLNNERAAYSEKLLKNPVFQSAYIDRSPIKDPEFLTQLSLDASAVLDKEQLDNITWGLLELLTREYIHRIHHKRLAELKRLST